jgi:hypothetical protein
MNLPLASTYEGLDGLLTSSFTSFLISRGIRTSEAFLATNTAMLATDMSREFRVAYDMAMDYIGAARLHVRRQFQQMDRLGRQNH